MANQLTRRQPARLSPFFETGPLRTLREEMDELFSRFMGEESEFFPAARTIPSLDLAETDNEIEVRVDLPGVNPDEIDIEIAQNVLTISGERKEEKEVQEGDGGKRFHRIERRIGSFSRAVGLPCAVQEDQVDAEYHEGVLTIKMPKAEESKAKKIKVKSHQEVQGQQPSQGQP